MNNVGSRTMAQAASEEGDGKVRPAPQPGRVESATPSDEGRAAGAAVPEDEAERLAAAQAERLRAREAMAASSKRNVDEVLQSAAPAQPTPVTELHVVLLSDGTVQLRGPINDPEKFMALIAQAFFVLHNHTVTKVRAETEAAVRAQAKVPFMKRVFSRPGKTS